MDFNRKITMMLPELGLIVGTRALIGAGLGLLLADKLSQETRKAVGWTLLGIGAVTTIPLGMQVFGGHHIFKMKENSQKWQPQQNDAWR